MSSFIKSDSLTFQVLERLLLSSSSSSSSSSSPSSSQLHVQPNSRTCSTQQKKRLKYRNLINDDCTLTIHGKTVFYAAKFGIPVMALKILLLLYCHKKSQSSLTVDSHPVSYVLIESLFQSKSNVLMHKSIRELLDKGLAVKYHYRTLLVSNRVYNMLKTYDADIVEIEGTFEY